MAESIEKKNLFQKLVGFFKGLKAEVKKIIWPNRSQTAKQTAAVIVISVVLCAFIRLIDVLAELLIGFVSSIF